jgi:hypothetical protein
VVQTPKFDSRAIKKTAKQMQAQNKTLTDQIDAQNKKVSRLLDASEKKVAAMTTAPKEPTVQGAAREQEKKFDSTDTEKKLWQILERKIFTENQSQHFLLGKLFETIKDQNHQGQSSTQSSDSAACKTECCAQCKQRPPTINCKDCELLYCGDCSKTMHSKGKLQ